MSHYAGKSRKKLNTALTNVNEIIVDLESRIDKMKGDFKIQKQNELTKWYQCRDEIHHELDKHRLNSLVTSVKTFCKSNGEPVDFDDWWEKAQTLYNIDDNFTVHSHCRNWKSEKGIHECRDLIEAQETVLQLMKYKATDRARGRGSYEQDEERIAEVEKMREDGLI